MDSDGHGCASQAATGHKGPHRDVVDPADLVPTYLAAKRLGVSRRTLQRWATNGLVTPDLTTPGGHYRWDVERLRAEIKALGEQAKGGED